MRTISVYTSLDLELPEEDMPNLKLADAVHDAILKQFTNFVVVIDLVTRDASGKLLSFKFSAERQP